MIKEDSPNRLLVEGRDDQWSVINLMKRYNVDWDREDKRLPYVKDSGGIDSLIESIVVSVKTYHRLGIMIDANSKPVNRWDQLRSQLSKAKITLPEKPEPDGLIVKGIDPDKKIGIWMMPDNSHPGILEDFLATLIPSEDFCWDYAGEATNKAKEKGAAFSSNDHIKARIHTWLAWQESPGRPFGTAITAAYFNCDTPEALRFAKWFKKLFLT